MSKSNEWQEKQQKLLEQAIAGIRSGEREAFSELYSCTEKYVYYCIRMHGVPENEAADVMQEVYAAIYGSLETLRDIHAALGWIKSITFHKSMDYFRRNNKELFIQTEQDIEEYDLQADNIELPEDIIENEASQKIVRDLIYALPEDYRQVLVAYYFEERKVDEIAEALDVPTGTVKTKLYRARKQLQKSVEQVEQEQGIRLHSVSAAPIFLLLFCLDAEAVAIPGEVSETVIAALGTLEKQTPVSKLSGTDKAASIGGKIAGNVARKYILAAVMALLLGGIILMIIKWNDDKKVSPASDTSNEISETADTEQASEKPQATDTEQASEESQAADTEQASEKPQTIDLERQSMLREYYHAMYDKMCETHMWHDGTDIAVSGDFMEALQYTLDDFDNDGYEEFAVSIISADYMAAYTERIYKYNPDTDECSLILELYPGASYYENGRVLGRADNSHRFGTDWFLFDEANEIFIRQAYIFEWRKNEWDNYEGHPFPDTADIDGDGVIWCFIDTEDNYTYKDQSEYEAWKQEMFDETVQLQILWITFSEGWQFE
ncbi:MAG: sigma-70 family RNA polymerase sigma factor [Clostridium sp.]|nr:sigma-70 family RNA polymerase sigma factor [Clostridium sp.]MCM1208206.1 sigma-70 family RNA polymerase sigma factor [Ruminococcus sp.]